MNELKVSTAALFAAKSTKHCTAQKPGPSLRGGGASPIPLNQPMDYADYMVSKRRHLHTSSSAVRTD